MNHDSTVSFELLERQDGPALIECVQNCFPSPKGEIMARILDISPDEYLPYTKLVCEKAVNDKFSFVAKNGAGKIVGFCIAEDYASMPQYSALDFGVKFSILLSLLEELDARYSRKHKITKNEVFHLYMLGVNPEYAKLGLATELIRTALQFAKERGFRSAVAEATGQGSQHICEKLGFVAKEAVDYETFTFAGKSPFQSILNPKACLLVERELY